jgi:hypothetical protein
VPRHAKDLSWRKLFHGAAVTEVPVNKTGKAFTKPVDRLVGEAIAAWEKVRPAQSKLTDSKTGELVDFLFLDEMRRVSLRYLDSSIIPMLCRIAGIPINDVRGRITSHRARSTIASQYSMPKSR